jgi:uncharacterized protein (DUF2336 family)
VLARRLASLLPNLAPASVDREAGRLRQLIGELVRDESARVRAAIAEIVKSVADAPRDLILSLARDEEWVVADPVIAASPVLTDEDLVALVTLPPVAATVVAVARRAGISEAVSDAIVATARDDAITCLLANHTAALREATLDVLIAEAGAKHIWHESLVRRPRLSAKAMLALSEVVAAKYLALLSVRADLPPDALTTVRGRLAATPPPPRDQTADACSETALLAALSRQDSERVAGILAAAADLTADIVALASLRRDKRALVSVAWKGGFSADTALRVQIDFGQIPPAVALAPKAGRYPLPEDDMAWRVDCLKRDARSRKQPLY